MGQYRTIRRQLGQIATDRRDQPFGRRRSRRGNTQASSGLVITVGIRRPVGRVLAIGMLRLFLGSNGRLHLATRQQSRAQPHGGPHEHKPAPQRCAERRDIRPG